jgi:CBS domain-containing protein
MTKIKDVMTEKCEWISPDTNLVEAAKLMKKCDCGFLPVGENDKLVGMVTDRDIAIRAVAEGKDPNATNVRDVMTSKTYYCYDDQDVSEVCENMGEIKVRRMPVVNRDKRLVGVVSFGDVSQAAPAKNVGESQQQITEGAGQSRKAA